MNAHRRLTVVSVLSFLGVLAASYLSKIYYDLNSGMGSFKSLCNIGAKFNCDVVAASPYAELFTGVPLSSLVAGWMLAILIVSLVARLPEFQRDGIRIGALFAFIGVILSAAYFYIMVVHVRTYCVVCLGLDALTVVIFGLFWSLKPTPVFDAPFDRSRIPTWAGIAAGSVFVLVVVLRSFGGQGVPEEMAEGAAQSVLATPPVAVADGAEFPTLGPADAPITIVEFSDLQCPACRMGAIGLKAVMARHPGDVKVVFRAYPLDSSCNRKLQHAMHPVACEATRVVFCAAEQGKFEAVYEAIFEKQADLAAGKPAEIAKSLGLDAARLEACVASDAIAKKVVRDIEEGITLNIDSTPTFFVNGHRVQGNYPPAVWTKIIAGLKKQKAAQKAAQ